MLLLRISRLIKAPLPFVFSWWTDFREGDPQLSGRVLKDRRVLRREGNLIELEDRGRMLLIGYRDRVRILLRPPRAWRAEYASNYFYAVSHYELREAEGGALLEVRTWVRFKGPLRFLAPLFKGVMERRIASEWEDFIAAIEEEYSKAARAS